MKVVTDTRSKVGETIFFVIVSRLGNAFTYVDSIILDTVDEDTVFPAFGFSLLTNMYRCLRCRFFLFLVVVSSWYSSSIRIGRTFSIYTAKSRESARLRRIYFVRLRCLVILVLYHPPVRAGSPFVGTGPTSLVKTAVAGYCLGVHSAEQCYLLCSF